MSTASLDVSPGTSITFVALPSPGWRFVRWNGASDSSRALLTLVVNSNVSLTAVFELEPAPAVSDLDGDGVPDTSDNCPLIPNADQSDSNHDDVGDACLPIIATDYDKDGVDDIEDNCVLLANPDQVDSDNDGVGDACELAFDFDGDGVDDAIDNCTLFANADQADSDGDGTGDACEVSSDLDGDDVDDADDNCVATPNATQADSDGDGVGDACESPTPPPPGATARIVDIYGNDIIVLSDGSVWEVTFGLTFGWMRNDRIVVQGSRLTNLDEDEEVSASFVGTKMLSDAINSISPGGEFVGLLGGTVWQVDAIDRFRTSIWLPFQRVLVVKAAGFGYRIVRESGGSIVRVSPAAP